jgi:putative oxidoreductase
MKQRPRGVTTVLWTAQIALAVVFVSVAVPRLLGTSATVETFDQIGLGQWLRYATGAVELAGAIGLLIPRLAGAAALGLAGVMAGATITNFLVLTPAMAALTITLGVVSAAIAAARWAEIRSLLALLRR